MNTCSWAAKFFVDSSLLEMALCSRRTKTIAGAIERYRF